jgi:hypothetical protein
MPVIVEAIRQETGCSRATAYRSVADAFADGTWSRVNVIDQLTEASQLTRLPGTAGAAPERLVVFVVRAHQSR